MRKLLRAAGFAAIVALGACSGTPPSIPPDTDIPSLPPTGSELVELTQPAVAAHPSLSGFEVLDTGRQAFLARAEIIEAATRSIDAQYYIWNGDASGRYLASRLLAAAERGVRVRVLLDDINVGSREHALAALDAHPQIEVQVYNPFAQRRGLRKMLDFLWEFTRLNRRMHNKSLTVDGALTVVGGRNIGDEYFDAADELNFRDRDVLAAGPVVAQTAEMFESFWSSPLARRASELVRTVEQPPVTEREAAFAVAEERLAELHGALPLGQEPALAALRARIDALLWAPAHLVFDGPPPPDELGDTDRSQASASALRELAAVTREDLLIESAYLVMGDDTLEGVEALRARGVRVRALTNSLASNDVTANHAAYARRRPAMLESGVELYELRPDAASCRKLVQNPGACGEGHVFGLHAKTFVLDRAIVYIGSLNLNLRSRYLNSESGMVIESPELAARVAADIEANMTGANSWNVQREADGAPVWIERDAAGAETTRIGHDPQTSGSRRATAAAIAALPLEKYL